MYIPNWPKDKDVTPETYPFLNENSNSGAYVSSSFNYQIEPYNLFVESEDVNAMVAKLAKVSTAEPSVISANAALLTELLKDPGMYSFFEYEVQGSELFASWILHFTEAVYSAVAFGFAPDFSGNLKRISASDPLFRYFIRDPALAFLRERTLENSKLAQSSEHVAVLGAGYLPEFTLVKGYTFKPSPKPNVNVPSVQRVSAFDSDSSVSRVDVLSHAYANHGASDKIAINYATDNIESVISDPRHRKEYDTVIINDLMPISFKELRRYIVAAYEMLAPGGQLAFDIKVKHWVWERNY